MHSSASPSTGAEESDALSVQLPLDAQSQGPATAVHVRTKRNFPGNLSHSPFRVAQEGTLGHESKGRGHSDSLHQQKTKSPRQGAMHCWGPFHVDMRKAIATWYSSSPFSCLTSPTNICTSETSKAVSVQALNTNCFPSCPAQL